MMIGPRPMSWTSATYAPERSLLIAATADVERSLPIHTNDGVPYCGYHSTGIFAPSDARAAAATRSTRKTDEAS